MEINAEEISKIIREQIGSYAVEVDVAEVGSVVSLGDGGALARRRHGRAHQDALEGRLLFQHGHEPIQLFPGFVGVRFFGGDIQEGLGVATGGGA